MNRLMSGPALEILVEKRGRVPADAVSYAQRKVHTVLGHVGEPVLQARVKLTQAARPAAPPTASAQATIVVRGRTIRARAVGGTLPEAVDLLQDRLATRLARARGHVLARHRAAGPPTPAPRETGQDGPGRAHRHHLPPEARRVVRGKSFALPPRTPADAICDLEAMDYDFLLFTDAVTGHDSVVYRDPASGCHRLASVPEAGRPGTTDPGIDVSGASAPDASVTQAVTRLDVTGLPFVFFRDRTTGRGSVLYHRYDGHYGLISPTADTL
ncbi:sigma 54 modulation/S30EA ribosomal C-terminal domain-containing protein [Streptomyces sp. NPDC097981]|uniref:sigma 54 modulation/S30EA ribosomal C-terminal domain-containing protein n=1 Tax=Streptomyces sp. NPDC097981 TaxID=3155428 RepID=UPI003328312F